MPVVSVIDLTLRKSEVSQVTADRRLKKVADMSHGNHEQRRVYRRCWQRPRPSSFMLRLLCYCRKCPYYALQRRLFEHHTLWNIGPLQDYTALYPRRLSTLYRRLRTRNLTFWMGLLISKDQNRTLPRNSDRLSYRGLQVWTLLEELHRPWRITERNSNKICSFIPFNASGVNLNEHC
jgi:hypothetical protein